MGNEIQPKLPDNYWQKQYKEDKNPLTDINTNFALKDLNSVFKKQK